jgi:hypothetical protein
MPFTYNYILITNIVTYNNLFRKMNMNRVDFICSIYWSHYNIQSKKPNSMIYNINITSLRRNFRRVMLD